jgi:hypothetical protein
MAYYFLTASKDASVYLQQPNQNTGLDEILEISKIYYGNVKDVAHTLIKFDLGFLSSSLTNNTIKMSEAQLLMKEAQTEEIPLEYTIFANAVSGSWEMGIGTRFDAITTKGVTWNYREGDTKLNWLDNDFNSYTTASINDGSGGTWWVNYSSSQNFNYQKGDIEMNVMPLLKSWMSGSIPNDGFILRYDFEREKDTQDYGIVRLFSKETFTIYQPKIRIGWNDQSFITGSLTPLTTTELKIGVKNFRKEYKKETKNKIRVFGRELYPLKTFANKFSYGDIKYLPQTTYYQIKDFTSDDIIIPFSEYSKLSCDSEGNYIMIDFSNWEANRTYKIEFKVDNDGDVQYFDEDLTFFLVAN